VALTITLNGAKLAARSVTVSGMQNSRRELREEEGEGRELALASVSTIGTSHWAVTLRLPRGVSVLKAVAPSHLGAGAVPVVNATQVYWPRIPLKEGPNKVQKITLRVRVGLEQTVDANTLSFTVTAKSGPYLMQAIPTPLQVSDACCLGDGMDGSRSFLCLPARYTCTYT
jgi:hypothetical protein